MPLSYQPPWGHTAHIPAAGCSDGGGSWRREGERGAAIPVSVCVSECECVCVCVCVWFVCGVCVLTLSMKEALHISQGGYL